MGRVDTECLRHAVAGHVKALRRDVQCVAAGGRIERADAAARLHRIRNDPVIAKIEPCDVSRRLKRDIGRPSVADRPVQADVVRIAPVQGICICVFAGSGA